MMAEKFWSRSNVRIGAAMRMFNSSEEVKEVPKGTGVFGGRAHHCEVLGAELGLEGSFYTLEEFRGFVEPREGLCCVLLLGMNHQR